MPNPSNTKNVEWLGELAAARGGLCLSTQYFNNRAHYTWECSKKHRWSASAGNVQQGCWCPYCAGKKGKNVEYLKELAAIKNGTCLSTVYEKMRTKYTWECSENHTWSAPANDVQQGGWCPECSGNIKYGLDGLNKLAAKHNGKCLSESYLRNNTIYLWGCHNGHKWESTLHPIKAGNWCRDCLGKPLPTLELLKKAAIKNSGKCHSTEYSGILSKYKWECAFGHTWEAVGNHILRGISWCPTCAKTYGRSQKEVFDFVKAAGLYAEYNKKGVLPNKRFEFDVYIPSLKKAIELDGERWHLMPGATERDLRKNQQCKDIGIQLLRIPYTTCWQGKRRNIGETMIRNFISNVQA